MRVSLNWLQQYIDLPTTDPTALTHALDMLGHAVEEVEVFEAEWTDVVIGRVLRIEPHPDVVHATLEVNAACDLPVDPCDLAGLVGQDDVTPAARIHKLAVQESQTVTADVA